MKTKIQKEITVAIKSRNTTKRDILRVLMGEIERKEQTPSGKIIVSGPEIISIIKKMVTNLHETSGDESEIEILSEYLPTTLSRFEIENIVDEFIVDNDLSTMRDIGRIMKHFSSTYTNRYDGKFVSTIIREVLSETDEG